MGDPEALVEANRRLADGLDLVARSWHDARHDGEGSFDLCRKNICTDARRVLAGYAIKEPEPAAPMAPFVAEGDPVTVEFRAS